MDHLPAAEAYATLLAGDGVLRGLIGPREADRVWERHLLNSAVVAPTLPQGATVCDVGSGAGLPGIPLAIVRPDVRMTLVEPLLRRVVFLEEVVAALGLANVEVVRARAEELHGSDRFAVVTSRAVAPLERLAAWCLPLVSPGGEMLAIKGRSASDEAAAAAAHVHRLGGRSVTVEEFGADLVEAPTTVIRVRVP